MMGCGKTLYIYGIITRKTLVGRILPKHLNRHVGHGQDTVVDFMSDLSMTRPGPESSPA